MTKNNPSFPIFPGFVLIVMIWLFIALRMWSGGYTGGDEAFTEMAAAKSGGILKAAFNMASSQGRFYQLWCYPIAQVPYLFDSLAWTNGFRIFSAIFPVLCFYYFVKTVFSSDLAVAASIVLALVQNSVGGSYNPFHALPLWFSLGIGFIFLSYATFYLWLRCGKHLCVAWILFGMSLLTYEVFLFYILGFPIFAYMYGSRDSRTANSFLGRMIFTIKASFPFVLVAILYLVFYLLFRIAFPPSYVGVSSLSLPTLLEFINLIVTFSSSGVVLSTNVEFYHINPYVYILVCALLAVAFFYTKRDDSICLGVGSFFKILLICALFAILPNLIFAFTDRYREWVLSDSYYHGSYYASFPIALALTISCGALMRKPKSFFSRRLFNVLLALFLVLLFISGIKNHNNSITYFEDSKRQSDRWGFVKTLGVDIKNKNYLEPGDTVCTDVLIGAYDAYDYWSYKIEQYSGKPIRVVYSKNPLECQNAIVRINGKLIFIIDKLEIFK